MKKSATLICFSATILLSGGILHAADFDYDTPAAQEARSACFKKFDTNNDGVLSMTEIHDGMKMMEEEELLRKYDTDGDGTLSESEKLVMYKEIEEIRRKKVKPNVSGGGGGGGNGRAGITIKKTEEEEIIEYRERWVKEWEKIIKFDADGDQKLSQEEFIAMRTQDLQERKQREEKMRESMEKNLLNRCVRGHCSAQSPTKNTAAKTAPDKNSDYAKPSDKNTTAKTDKNTTAKTDKTDSSSSKTDSSKPMTTALAGLPDTPASSNNSSSKKNKGTKIILNNNNNGSGGVSVTH